MGITIHYTGKAKSPEAIDTLILELGELALKSGWEYGVVEKAVKGEFCPSWGYGFGFIPTRKQIEEEGIEFFSALVSKKCNGYFKIWNFKYQEAYRNAFKKGQWPNFFVDTNIKGIWLNVHPKCDGLEFVFDLATLELVSYQEYDHTPGIIHGYEKFFCKTQYAGVKTHITVCKIIELTEKYIDYSDIYDEAGFYKTKDMQKAAEAFWENSAMIKNIGEKLKKMGFEIVSGEKL